MDHSLKWLSPNNPPFLPQSCNEKSNSFFTFPFVGGWGVFLRMDFTMEPGLLSLLLTPQVLNFFYKTTLVTFLPTSHRQSLCHFLCFPRPLTSSILHNIIIYLSRFDQCPLLFLVPSLGEITERGFVCTK